MLLSFFEKKKLMITINETKPLITKQRCGCDWRHMIAVAMNITTKRLIIHEAESTHKYHHKHPLESFRNP